MIIDCGRCAVRDLACGDCVIGVLLGAPEVPRKAEHGHSNGGCDAAEVPLNVPPGARMVQLDAPERRALAALADQGLVPRLRLVATRPRRATVNPHREGRKRRAG